MRDEYFAHVGQDVVKRVTVHAYVFRVSEIMWLEAGQARRHRQDTPDRWRDLLSSAFAEVDIDERGGFECQIRVQQSLEIQFTVGEGTPHGVRTRPSMRGGRACLSLVFSLSGETEVIQNNMIVRMHDREATFIDLKRPYEIRHNSDFQVMTITVPEHALEGFYRRAKALIGHKFLFEGSAFPIHMDYIRQITAEGDRAAADDIRICATAAVALIRNLIIDTTGIGAVSDHVALKLRLLDRYISENVHEPALDRSRIAQGIGYSVRELNRTLRAVDSSLSRRLKEKRLARAAELLQDGLYNRMSITDIAFECGFVQSSTFSRAFAAQHGLPPRRFRELSAVHRRSAALPYVWDDERLGRLEHHDALK